MFTDDVAPSPNGAVATLEPEPEDVRLLAALREALDTDSLSLSYQPVVRSGDGRIIGFEALLRWHSLAHGQVSPARMLPLAERAGMMPEIGRWVIATATRQLAEWQRAGLAHDRSLHVNLSLPELLDPDLPTFVAAQVAATGLKPSQLCFEVTEEDLNLGGVPAERAMEAMVAAGFQPVLDDFGLHSSVEILTRHPFQFAKIAHDLVSEQTRPRHWARLLRGIGGLARSLHITLVIEGVEGEQEMARIAALGFAHAQGYAFGRPESADDFSRTLAGGRNWLDART
jgi:diguanylate cyclase